MKPIAHLYRLSRSGLLTPLLACLLLLAGCSISRADVVPSAPGHFANRPQVREFIDRMVERHGFDKSRLEALFAKAKPQPGVIRAMEHPAEALPWYKYRSIFLTKARIRDGVAFWRAHQAVLARARQVYGVPAQIVVAILGVESFYGKRMGHWPVFDTLATLGFDYPPRAAFFREQLAQYLLLAKEDGFNPMIPTGSYAGAMGQGQFIPSSYRQYAVDFDGDGKRNLWTDTGDAIGSIANYFSSQGWRPGGGVAVPARSKGAPYADHWPPLRPSFSIAQLRRQGIKPEHPVAGGGMLGVVRLEGAKGPQYWVCAHNFYVITRYNHSPLYAMAVYQLSEAIRTAYRQPTISTETLASRGR